MTQQAIQPSLLLAAVFAASTLGASHATAATKAPAAQARPEAAASPTTTPAIAPLEGALSGNGVRAYIDPKTHKLRPATEEERAAEARVSAAAPAPKFKIDRLANGALRAQDLNGSLMEEVEATRNPDGSVTLSYDAAGAPTSQPAAKLEEK
jgi:hypothetical protein